MTGMSYDPDADAVYIYVGRGTVDHQEEAGPFITDVDAEGRVVGIEILSASKVLAPGDWQKARRPSETNVDAAASVARIERGEIRDGLSPRSRWRFRSRGTSKRSGQLPDFAALDPG